MTKIMRYIIYKSINANVEGAMKRLREDKDYATEKTTRTTDAKTTKLNPDAKVAKLLTTHGKTHYNVNSQLHISDTHFPPR